MKTHGRIVGIKPKERKTECDEKYPHLILTVEIPDVKGITIGGCTISQKRKDEGVS